MMESMSTPHELDAAGRCTRCGVEWRADHDDDAYGEYYDAAGAPIGYSPGPCTPKHCRECGDEIEAHLTMCDRCTRRLTEDARTERFLRDWRRTLELLA